MATILYPYATGKTLDFQVIDATGKAWNGTAFVDMDTAPWASLAIPMPEIGNTGRYPVNFPAVPAGLYGVIICLRAGSTPAKGDVAVSTSSMDWNGTAEVSNASIASQTSAIAAQTSTIATQTTGTAIQAASLAATQDWADSPAVFRSQDGRTQPTNADCLAAAWITPHGASADDSASNPPTLSWYGPLGKVGGPIRRLLLVLNPSGQPIARN